MRMWNSENPLTVLMGVYIGTAFLEGKLASLNEVENAHILWPINSTPKAFYFLPNFHVPFPISHLLYLDMARLLL